ncbi:Serine/threonine protein kinase [Handroanthus impetiginosus]|uniref:Serine/threonine protein kinase n=1 Tax=Handroanthus impetiginosus TaxID=429701 RepID=A0A2G9HWT0_9LAMI|nr:Serine/threonine protein kinase [Handroanthus impetiginosus]
MKFFLSFPRFLLLICLSWSFLIWDTHELQSSQTQVLFQLRKQLEYPKQLDYWLNPGIDLCFSSSPQVNITCQDNIVTEIRIFGDKHTRGTKFNGFPVSYQTLSQNFSMDSLVATLSRLNSLRVLSLVSLGIWGPIPDKIHRLQSLEYLDLSWNFLYGSIPRTISRIVKLEILKLDGNFLNGTLPDCFDSFSNLTSLSLRNNQFSGPLPSSIQRIVTLTDITLSNNGISGKLPDFSSLSNLRWLDLSNNKLDSVLSNMPKSVVAVLLSNNSFSGKIPEQYGKLNQLQQLDLSFNALQDSAPVGLFTLPNITSLNLASNMLIGSLPMQLSCGRSLELVDISNNRLRGRLPSCLSSNVKTRVVKFGGNCLLVDLKHQHQETYCVENIQEKKKSQGKNSVGILIGVIVGIAVVMGLLAFGFLVFCRQYCPRGTSEQHLLHKPVQDNSATGFTAEILTSARLISDAGKVNSQGTPVQRLFLLDELRAATNNFDKATLMGEGLTGKIYKGRLENGALVAIRCLTVSKKYTIRNLKLRLDLLAKLRHPHLVCLLGHCIEIEGKYESGANRVYLIYEYVPNGTYRAHLSETNPEKVLKWSDRLAILIGIAKAVHFLHTGIIPGFYSNRLEANNILLNEHRIGKLSDYGLSVVAQEIDKDKEEDGLKSWQMKNLEDDIYSFGCILLESLIGPSVLARKESFLLNEMVSLGNPDGQKRIVDPIVLASCSQESLSIVISLTINCISPESSTRPSFEDVLWNLQYAAQVQATSDDKRSGKTVLSP